MATTVYKGAYLPTVAGDSGVWGAKLNSSLTNSTFPVFDAALGGITAKSLTNANVTLSAAESGTAILRLIGTLSANINIVTSCQGFTFVENATTGAYSITIANGVGTPLPVPQGMCSVVIFDATNGPRDAASSAADTPGTVKDYLGTTAPSGWIMASGLTIGDASSSGTGRANSDTLALFTLLWNSYSNSILAVSGGRGSSAAADYAAHKTIAIPDLRGRVTAGKDDMGGSDAARFYGAMSGTVLGSSGGEAMHTLTTAEIPQHSHGVTDPGHHHSIFGTTETFPMQSNNRQSLQNPGWTITGDSVTGISIQNTGGGTSHINVQPTWIVNKIIKL
jgi:microcystin-dependent protein